MCRWNHWATETPRSYSFHNLDWALVFFLKMGHFRPLFSLFSSFLQTVNRKHMFNKSCRWLDSNPGPLVSEATALPTAPQPLPQMFSKILCLPLSFSHTIKPMSFANICTSTPTHGNLIAVFQFYKLNFYLFSSHDFGRFSSILNGKNLTEWSSEAMAQFVQCTVGTFNTTQSQFESSPR